MGGDLYMDAMGVCPDCGELLRAGQPRHQCADKAAPPLVSLNFAELRGQNTARCNRWHQGGIEEWTVSDWAVAMLGEAGEAANAVKKLRRIETGALNLNEPGRQLTERETAIHAIGEELADTLIYLDLLALRLGISLEEAVVRKFNKVSERYGFPERLYDPDADQRGSYDAAIGAIREQKISGGEIA